MLGRPIYYMQVTISYQKKKIKLKKKSWLVTTKETARDIMLHDKRSMISLENRVYGAAAKKGVVIIKIDSKKIIGETNH